MAVFVYTEPRASRWYWEDCRGQCVKDVTSYCYQGWAHQLRYSWKSCKQIEWIMTAGTTGALTAAARGREQARGGWDWVLNKYERPGWMPVVSICFHGVSACFSSDWYMRAKRAWRFIVLWHLTEIIQWTWPEGWFKKKRKRKKKFLGFTGLFKACLLHFSPLLSCPFLSFWPL